MIKNNSVFALFNIDNSINLKYKFRTGTIFFHLLYLDAKIHCTYYDYLNRQ